MHQNDLYYCRMGELTNTKRRVFIFIMVLLPLIIPFSLAEMYLRISGDYSTYSERRGNGYESYYGQSFADSLWQYPINHKMIMDHGEFRYHYQTNNLGVCETHNFDENDTSVYRIITLGDSFTEGRGAPADSSWPHIFEKKLNLQLLESGREVQVYNAGVSGSDPVLNFMMLKKRLLNLKPDLVIQSFNTSDLNDYLFRGGLDRYRDGGMKFKNGPWWERLYRISHVFRMVVCGHLGYSRTLVKQDEQVSLYNEAIKSYRHLIYDKMQPLADSCAFEMLYLFQPMPDQLRYNCCNYEYLIELDTLVKGDGLLGLDLVYSMQKIIGKDFEHKYDWPVDRHYNSNGYYVLGNLMADTIYQLIESGDIDLWRVDKQSERLKFAQQPRN